MDLNKGVKVKTVEEALVNLHGILYFIDQNCIEIEDEEVYLSKDMKVLSVRHIENDEYEIMIEK